MMGYQNHGGPPLPFRHFRQGGDEALPRPQVQPRPRLVQQQQFRVGHQSPGDQHPFHFPRRQGGEFPVGEVGHPHRLQTLPGPFPVSLCVGKPADVGENGMAAGDHDGAAGQAAAHQRGGGCPHVPDTGTEVPYIGAAHLLPQNAGGPGGGELIGGNHLQQGGFTSPVGPEHHPPLPRLRPPVHLRQQTPPRFKHGNAAQVNSGRLDGGTGHVPQIICRCQPNRT